MPKDFYQKYKNRRTVNKAKSQAFEDTMPEYIRLWFGKHKGEMLSSVPIDYMKWLRENITFKNDKIPLLLAVFISLKEQKINIKEYIKQGNKIYYQD